MPSSSAVESPRTKLTITSLWQVRATKYALAVALTLVTIGTRVSLGHEVRAPTMIVFAIPIILSAYWGGLGPGLLATVISTLGAAYYLLPPLQHFGVGDPVHIRRVTG